MDRRICKKIEEETGQRNFTYRVAATKIIHDKKVNYLEKIQNNEKMKKDSINIILKSKLKL